MTSQYQSTRGHGIGPFDAHGTRTNRIEGRVLISTFRGPFNVELVKAAGGSALQLRQSLMETGTWGYIEIIEHSAMATPDAIAEMTRANEDPQRNLNRIAAAVVLSHGIEGGRVAGLIYKNAWRGVTHPFKIFSILDDAKSWINEQF